MPDSRLFTASIQRRPGAVELKTPILQSFLSLEREREFLWNSETVSPLEVTAGRSSIHRSLPPKTAPPLTRPFPDERDRSSGKAPRTGKGGGLDNTVRRMKETSNAKRIADLNTRIPRQRHATIAASARGEASVRTGLRSMGQRSTRRSESARAKVGSISYHLGNKRIERKRDSSKSF